MTTTTVTEIRLTVGESELFDTLSSEEREQYDIDGSVRAYCEILADALRAEYPTAEISVEPSQSYTGFSHYVAEPYDSDAEADVQASVKSLAERIAVERATDWAR